MAASNHSHESVGAKVQQFISLILHWQQRINLISDSTTGNIIPRHIEDSLQLSQIIQKLSLEGMPIYDLGSGAGFPGLILSLYGHSDVHLVESDKRKAAFLREALQILALSATVRCARAETISYPTHCIFVSRALASLDDLLRMIDFKSRPHCHLLIHKGEYWHQEVEEARHSHSFAWQAYPSSTHTHSVILHITHHQSSGGST